MQEKAKTCESQYRRRSTVYSTSTDYDMPLYYHQAAKI